MAEEHSREGGREQRGGGKASAPAGKARRVIGRETTNAHTIHRQQQTSTNEPGHDTVPNTKNTKGQRHLVRRMADAEDRIRKKELEIGIKCTPHRSGKAGGTGNGSRKEETDHRRRMGRWEDARKTKRERGALKKTKERTKGTGHINHQQ
ncbi:MAG: hypothetical protein ACI4OJ_13720 [Lachnospiraceae bacterium]